MVNFLFYFVINFVKISSELAELLNLLYAK